MTLHMKTAECMARQLLNDNDISLIDAIQRWLNDGETVVGIASKLGARPTTVGAWVKRWFVVQYVRVGN